MDEIFNITEEYIELNKLLKAIGWCSTGGEAHNLITRELIKVDGELETRKRRKVKNGMRVEYASKSLKVISEPE